MVVNGLASSMILFYASGNANAQLRPGSASRWDLIREEVHRRYGWYPEITSAGDGFRSLARQEMLFRKNYTTTNTGYGPPKGWLGDLWWRKTSGTPSAAVPGTSNHGYGTTADVVNVGTLNQFKPTTVRYNQFADVATEYAWSNAEGRSIGEPWHWSDTMNPDVITGSNPGGNTPAPPAQENDDMTPAEYDALIVRLNQIVSMVAQVYARDGEIAADVVLAKDNAFASRVLGVENQNALSALAATAAAIKSDTSAILSAGSGGGSVNAQALATAVVAAINDTGVDLSDEAQASLTQDILAQIRMLTYKAV